MPRTQRARHAAYDALRAWGWRILFNRYCPEQPVCCPGDSFLLIPPVGRVPTRAELKAARTLLANGGGHFGSGDMYYLCHVLDEVE